MKRFTDSEKWSDKFFRTLTPTGKIFWMWLCDNCDNAGIWERDDDLFQFFTGIDVKVDDLIEELGDRIEIVDGGKILLPKFVLFQQGGMLQEAKAPHRQIIRLLEKNGLEQRECGEIRKAKETLSKGKAKARQRVSVTLPKVTSNSNGKGNSKGKGKGEEFEKGGETPETEIPLDLREGDLEETWNSWHLHLKDLGRPRPFGQALIATLETFRDWGVERSSAAIRYSIKNNWYSIHEEKGISSQNRKEKIHESDRDYDNATSLT
jgi:hypothetical protein